MIGTNAFSGKNGLHVAHATLGGDHGAHSDALAHKLLFGVMFAIFLPAKLVQRALPAPQGKASKFRRSVFDEAKIAASTVSAYAFMG